MIDGIVVLEERCSQDVLIVFFGVLMSEDSENADSVMIEVLTIEEVRFRLNAEIVFRSELDFKWPYQLIKVRAVSPFHKTIFLILAIYARNLILP